MRSKTKAFSSERMYTNRLIIERLKASDYNFFKNITGDPIIWRYFKEYHQKQLKKYFIEKIVEKQSPYNLSLVIRKSDETPIGILSMYFLESGVWLVEYALLEVYRGHGYMTELIEYICTKSEEFLLTFRANTMAINELLFEVPNDNIESSRLISKISQKLRLHCDISMTSFYNCFKSKTGWTWYRIKL